MKYSTMTDAVFLQRPNRFIAHCSLNGEEVVAHVKNTGRCKELLVPGCKVYLQDHRQESGSRKTQFSLIAVEKRTEKGTLLINMDSQAPNAVAEEALWSGAVQLPLEDGEEILAIRREVKYGDSRFDLQVSTNKKIWYVEVKGVTLEEDCFGQRTARFPDAPTERGVKHIRELVSAKKAGCGAAVLFIIQMQNVERFTPNWRTHTAFGLALGQAQNEGVAVLAYDCHVMADSLQAGNPVPVELNHCSVRTDFSTEAREELFAVLDDGDREFLAAHHNGKAKLQNWQAQALMKQAAMDLGFQNFNIRRSETGAPVSDVKGLYVSASHTDGCVAAAASVFPIGIDAEAIAPAREKVAQRMFHPSEIAWMNAHPDKDYAFTLLWTLKEAYGKLLGVGLSAAKDMEFFPTDEGISATDKQLKITTEQRKNIIISTIERLSD